MTSEIVKGQKHDKIAVSMQGQKEVFMVRIFILWINFCFDLDT